MSTYLWDVTLGTYTIEDLSWLLDLEERCADLPATAVEDLAIEINKARLSGKSKDDPELRLRIQRAFQAQKLSLTGDLDYAREVIQNKELQLKDALEKRKIVEEAYASTFRKQLQGDAKQKLIKALIINSFTGAILTVGAIYITLSVVSPDQMAVFWGLLLTALSPAITVIFRIFHSVIPNYRTLVEGIDAVVSSKIDQMLENKHG
ncbi:MAG: hypothetical protein QME52_10850 [Bacteroidota bacterium]|nr:hypothetical protein [Bacteroidota bacterium]